MASVVVFLIDGHRYALALETVERVLRAVQVTPLPRAPLSVAGAIDVHGMIVPVFDMRARLGLEPRRLAPSDCLVLARCNGRTVALIADAVAGTQQCEPQDVIDAETLVPGLDGVKGVARTADGMILIHDLQRFLSPDEERALDDALRRA